MNNKIICDECGAIFKVVSSSKDQVCFCPFCGEEVDVKEYDDGVCDDDEENKWCG